jgi:hypothetical protein
VSFSVRAAQATSDRLTIDAGGGADVIDAVGVVDPLLDRLTLIGGAGDDTITGSRFADVIDGGSGVTSTTAPVIQQGPVYFTGAVSNTVISVSGLVCGIVYKHTSICVHFASTLAACTVNVNGATRTIVGAVTTGDYGVGRFTGGGKSIRLRAGTREAVQKPAALDAVFFSKSLNDDVDDKFIRNKASTVHESCGSLAQVRSGCHCCTRPISRR